MLNTAKTLCWVNYRINLFSVLALIYSTHTSSTEIGFLVNSLPCSNILSPSQLIADCLKSPSWNMRPQLRAQACPCESSTAHRLFRVLVVVLIREVIILVVTSKASSACVIQGNRERRKTNLSLMIILASETEGTVKSLSASFQHEPRKRDVHLSVTIY